MPKADNWVVLDEDLSNPPEIKPVCRFLRCSNECNGKQMKITRGRQDWMLDICDVCYERGQTERPYARFVLGLIDMLDSISWG